MISRAIQLRFSRFTEARMKVRAKVSLGQRNIYILPTKEGLLFSALLLLMLLTAINYQNSLIYLLCFLLGALFVVSMWVCFLNMSGLEIKSLENQAVFAGEQGVFGIRLRSNGRPHAAIMLGFDRDNLQEVNVEPGGTIDVSVAALLAKRGEHRMDKIKLETRFPFGLLMAWTWQKLDASVMVYPAPIAAEKQPLNASDAQAGKTDVMSDDVSSIRPYAPGDRMNRISWKHYAARDELFSKEQHSGGGATDWLSLEDYPNAAIEQKLSHLCADILRLSRESKAFGLKLGAVQIAVGNSRHHTQQCLQALALY